MSEVIVGLRNSPSQVMARQRIEARINLQKLYAAIDADPAIVGAGVVYIDADFNVLTLREFSPVCSIKPKRIILREAKPYIAPQQFAQQVQSNPRESRLLYEAFNTTMSCGGAVLGWIAVFSGSVAVPFSAGASLVVSAIGAAAASASSAQCFVGVGRVYNEAYDPAANDALDNEQWYQNVCVALDAVSLIGVGTTGLTTYRLLQARKAATGRSWYNLSKELNRQERKRLTDELLKLQHPQLTPKLLKLQRSSGALPKRFTPTQIKPASVLQMQDALSIGSGLLGSNTVQTIAVGLYEELAQ